MLSLIVAEGARNCVLARRFGFSPKHERSNSHSSATPRRAGSRRDRLREGEWVAGKQGRVFVQKHEGLRSTSHLCNNGADNGQRASTVSLKHALNSREPTNWLKPREPGRNQLPLPRPLFFGGGRRSCLIETTKSLFDPFQRCCYSVRMARKREKRKGRQEEKVGPKERDRKRQDRLPGLNWNCHVRASEAN